MKAKDLTVRQFRKSMATHMDELNQTGVPIAIYSRRRLVGIVFPAPEDPVVLPLSKKPGNKCSHGLDLCRQCHSKAWKSSLQP